MKKALITGIAGQDGSYLADFLLDMGYEVYGTVKITEYENREHELINVEHILNRITIYPVPLNNSGFIKEIIKSVRPDECYHLAASSFVSYTFDDELSTFNNNVQSTHHLLAALKEHASSCRTYFAGSSEMFGRVTSEPQDENTSFNPRSIYGISKLSGYHLARNYREINDMFICTGILYNHESPRRGFEFVTRKITSTVAKIKLGLEKKLYLGNLDAVRDWGYAPEYVRAMWLMLQQNEPDDYVIATGELHSVRQFVDYAFQCVDLDYKKYVAIDQQFYRESEKMPLRGDSSKAYRTFGWKSQMKLEEIIHEMIAHDMALIKKDQTKRYKNEVAL